jgi:hypothetical protein
MKHQIIQFVMLHFSANVRSSIFSTSILMKNTRVRIDQDIFTFAHTESFDHSASKIP